MAKNKENGLSEFGKMNRRDSLNEYTEVIEVLKMIDYICFLRNTTGSALFHLYHLQR